MYCSNCGSKVFEGSNFCSFCGKDLRNIEDLNPENVDSKNEDVLKSNLKIEEKETTPGLLISESISDDYVSAPINSSEEIPYNVKLNSDITDDNIELKTSEPGENDIKVSEEITAPVSGDIINENKKAKVFMGEYDYSEFKTDEGKVVFSDEDNDEPIFDRDLVLKEKEKHNISDKFRKPILILVLLAMAIGAFYGIKYVNESKIKREEQLRIQEELRKAEELRKQIEGYLTLTDGYIVEAEKQMSNFEKNLEQLSKIETANWFKKLNFGKLFNSVVDTLIGMDSYTQMSGVSKNIGDKLNDLNNPPDSMRDIYIEAQKVSTQEKAITAAFTDDLKKKTYDELKEMIQSLSDSIYTLKDTADGFR